MNSDAENQPDTQPTTQTEPPNRKRARVDSPEPPEPKRHEKLWFEDGNVVLQAGDTMFRVYRGMLCNASVIFRDMFSMPQPPEGETIEGVPHVKLHDSPWELADLLDVLYDGKQFVKQSTKPRWTVVQSLYRLGSKYEVLDLRDAALHYIRRLHLGTPQKRKRLYDSTTSPVIYEPADIIAMANLIPEFNIGKVLHVGFLYACCQLTVKELLDGIPHSRGYVERLTPDNLRWCMEGRANLIVASAEMVNRCIIGMPTCPHADCSRILRHQITQEGHSELLYNPNPLGFWEIPRFQDRYNELKSYMCPACLAKVQTLFDTRKQDLYLHMDQYFKLAT
ncbi:hypothetical protein NM688_g1092 [Phlebia brevispora]|uniref:Uncharacterized protein n=1 Tax=Phlebia brevispora TaxID=194682 RepID=A0ACC1TC98_9APHY|nr:hypothetical protein NM688_g1092 [Phlebia brevispora]